MAPVLEKTPFDDHARPGELVTELGDGKLVCTACGHRCELRPGQRGVCKVRFNEDGVLKVPAHYAAGVHNDPIEKKPFFHALPGSRALSFGMLGCDFKCGYCQNWFTSQTLRDDDSTQNFTDITAQELCAVAKREGAETIVSTYNEPLITSEWAVEVFKEAKQEGFHTAYVSNGHGTPEVIEYIQPYVDFYKVDLKCYDEKKYRLLGGNFHGVLDTLRMIPKTGMWLEVVTLVIPDYNDSDQELSSMAEFLAEQSPDIPWHVTAFHPDYKMMDRGRTPAGTLLRAYECGRRAGLNYIYCGNLPGQMDGMENTVCPNCEFVLIERMGFRVLTNRLLNGCCPGCKTEIAGRW